MKSIIAFILYFIFAKIFDAIEALLIFVLTLGDKVRNFFYPDSLKKNSIVEEIYCKKIKQYTHAMNAIGVCILIYCINIKLFSTEIKMELLIFLFVLFGLTIILRILISYRIKKGYYGSNYEEGKEMLYYLLVDQDNNKNSVKKIFNKMEECNNLEEKLPVSAGNWEY